MFYILLRDFFRRIEEISYQVSFCKPAEWGVSCWRGLLSTSSSEFNWTVPAPYCWHVDSSARSASFILPCCFYLNNLLFLGCIQNVGLLTLDFKCERPKKTPSCQCSRWHHCVRLLEGFENLSSKRDIAASLLAVWLITTPWYSLMPTQFQGLKPEESRSLLVHTWHRYLLKGLQLVTDCSITYLWHYISNFIRNICFVINPSFILSHLYFPKVDAHSFLCVEEWLRFHNSTLPYVYIAPECNNLQSSQICGQEQMNYLLSFL